MKNKLSYPALNQINFGVIPQGYVTLRDLTFKNVTVPKGYIFDGITAKAPFTVIFSNDDLRNGIKAACFHDYLCDNKNLCRRKEATTILINLWKQDGLGRKWYNSWKPWLVYVCVEIYQIMKGWK